MTGAEHYAAAESYSDSAADAAGYDDIERATYLAMQAHAHAMLAMAEFIRTRPLVP